MKVILPSHYSSSSIIQFTYSGLDLYTSPGCHRTSPYIFKYKCNYNQPSNKFLKNMMNYNMYDTKLINFHTKTVLKAFFFFFLLKFVNLEKKIILTGYYFPSTIFQSKLDFIEISEFFFFKNLFSPNLPYIYIIVRDAFKK